MSPSASVSPSFSLSASPSPTPADEDSSGYDAWESGGTAQHVANEFINLGHLIGETVTVFGTDVDGITVVYDDEVVDASGDIDISSEDPHAHNFVKIARVGLRYIYIIKPMRLDMITSQGTTKGSIKKFAEVVISFFKTRGAKQGKDVDNLHTISDLPTDGSSVFTGDTVVSTDGGYSVEDNFCISGEDPTPCVVRAIVPRVKKIGR